MFTGLRKIGNHFRGTKATRRAALRKLFVRIARSDLRRARLGRSMEANEEGLPVKRVIPLLGLALCCATLSAPAAETESFDTSASNLLALLRESPGANKQDDSLRPMGRLKGTLPDGRVVEFEASWFDYLGDLHLRLVFDGERSVQSAMPEDLQRLHLSPEEALERAVDNLRKRYGPAVAQPWSGGLMQVQGTAAELNSSFLLDRTFWQEQLKAHPDGVVVAAPRRGGVVFAPASDAAAVLSLRFSAAALYAADERERLSSALYLFKQGRWTVFQPARPNAD
jgi:hypothetical protein